MKPLWNHQAQALELSHNHDSFAYLMEPGTGKTRIAIEKLKSLFEIHGPLPTLIFAPSVVLRNWEREIDENSDIPYHFIHVLSGPIKERLKAMTIVCSPLISSICIVNYEALDNKKFFDALMEWAPQLIICDESHRIKNPSAKRTKKIHQLAKKAKFRFCLTGTPVLKNYMDLWSQFKFLDLGETLSDNFFTFRGLYFFNKNAHAPSHVTWPDWQISPSQVEILESKIKSKSFSVKKEECLDLPPLIEQNLDVELSNEQGKAYSNMFNDFIAYISDTEACVATTALTKALRLQQIVSGFMRTDDDRVVRFSDVPRLDALKDLLMDYAPNSKVIVWACFKENYAMIEELCEKLALDYALLTGEQNANQKDLAVDKFRNDPNCRVLISNPAAGGIGINLIESPISIYYSRNFSLEAYLQSKARNYRGGSEMHESITQINLIAGQTIDEDIDSSLKDKKSIGDRIMKKDFTKWLMK